MTTATNDLIEETQVQSSDPTDSACQTAAVEKQQQKKSVAVESSLRVNISLLDSLIGPDVPGDGPQLKKRYLDAWGSDGLCLTLLDISSLV